MNKVYNDELNQMIAEANKYVLVSTAAAATAGAVPLPFADMPILIGNQIIMLVKIDEIFKIEVKTNRKDQ